MALPVINFAAIQPQGDPMMASILPSLQRGLQYKYSKPMMEEELQKQKLLNSLLQTQSMYADPMAEADLSYAQGRIPYQNAETESLKSQTSGQNLQNALSQIDLDYARPMKQADLDLKKLDIPYKKTQTQLMPAETLAKLLSGAGRYNQASWQSSPNSQFIRTLNNPQMQTLIAKNPDVGASVTRTLGNIGMGNNTGGNSGNSFQLNNDMINSILGIQNQQQPSFGNDTGQQSLTPWAQQMQQQMSAGQPQLSPMNQGQPMGSQNQQSFNPSQNDIKAVRQAAADAFFKNTRTAQQLNQGTYANTLSGIMEQGDALMPSVMKYAGVLGQFKGKSDSALNRFSEESNQDYTNYRNFVDHIVPLAAGEMGRALGKNSTDEQTRMLKEVANPVKWDSNPEMALSQWNYLTGLFKNTIDPSVVKRNSEIYTDLSGNPVDQEDVDMLTVKPEEIDKMVAAGIGTPGRAAGMSSGNNMPTQEDLEYMASLYGMTVNQVKKRLGV